MEMKVISNARTRYCMHNRTAENRNRLYRVALAWCGDSSLACELVQETLTISVQRCSRLREQDTVDAPMYRILSNCWQSHLARRKTTSDIEYAGLSSDGDTETQSSEPEMVDRVRAAILKLPVGQRQTITLVDLAGMSYAEVSGILDIPLDTVMSRLHISRNSLQNALKRYSKTRRLKEPGYEEQPDSPGFPHRSIS